MLSEAGGMRMQEVFCIGEDSSLGIFKAHGWVPGWNCIGLRSNLSWRSAMHLIDIGALCIIDGRSVISTPAILALQLWCETEVLI